MFKEVKKIRREFSVLKKKYAINFDNAASTYKPAIVVNVLNYYNTKISANSGKGIYKSAYEATKKVEYAREVVAKFLNVSPAEIIFTKNTTEAINLVVLSYALNNLHENDEIITSALEHHSNILPWKEVCNKTGAKLVYVPLTKDNKITASNFKKVLSDKTKLVALTHISNVLGVKTPVREIARLAHKQGAVVLIDGAQAVVHHEVDLKKLDCDFYAFSGYKIFGPTGVGVLYGKKELLDGMSPVFFGGGMVNDASPNNPTYKNAPEKFEAGTLPVGQILGLAQALEFVSGVGFDLISDIETVLKNHLHDELSKIKEVELYNKGTDVPMACFNINGIHPHDAATLYDELGINVRAGNHCAQPLMEHLGQKATLRVSLVFYNTQKEIDKFILATKKIIDFFKEF